MQGGGGGSWGGFWPFEGSLGEGFGAGGGVCVCVCLSLWGGGGGVPGFGGDSRMLQETGGRGLGGPQDALVPGGGSLPLGVSPGCPSTSGGPTPGEGGGPGWPRTWGGGQGVPCPLGGSLGYPSTCVWGSLPVGGVPGMP